MTAKLAIEADSAPMRRFFSDITESSRRNAEAMAGHFGKYIASVESGLVRLKQAYAATLAAEDEMSKRFEENLADRARRRGQQAQDSARSEGNARASAKRDEVSDAERAEKKITDTVRRGSAERKQIASKEAQARADAFMAVGTHIASAAASYAGAMYDKSQDARGRRAVLQSVVADPIREAGGTIADVNVATDRVRQFAAAQHIKSTDIAEALANYQTTYSGLGNANTSQADRTKNLDKFFNLAAYSRDVGLSVEEGTSLAGEMNRQGVTDESIVKAALNSASAIGQYGSVAGKQVLAQGKGPLVTRIKRAVSEAKLKGASGEQLQHVVLETMKDVMSEMEVSAASGEQVGTSGTNLKNLQAALNSPVRQKKMLTNIRTTALLDKDQKKALIAGLFQTDKNGNAIAKLKEGLNDPVEFAKQWTTAVGTDPKMVGLLEGGGHGNPQSITSPQRKMLEYLVGAGIAGAGWEQQRAMRDATLSDADVKRQHDIAMSLDQGTMDAQKEQADIALQPGAPGAANESAFNKAANWWADFQRKDPAGAAGVEAAVPAVTAAGGMLLKKVAPSAANWLGNLLPKVGGFGLKVAGTAGFLSDFLHPTDTVSDIEEHEAWAKGDWEGGTTEQRRAKVQGITDALDEGAAGGGAKGAAMGWTSNMIKSMMSEQGDSAINNPVFLRLLSAAIEMGLSKAKITAVIDPHDAAQARSASAGQQTRTPAQ